MAALPPGRAATIPPVDRTQEGGTPLYLPKVAAQRGPGRRARVFYNPAMGFDRDLNVAVGTALRSTSTLARSGWEMLGATGVRGLRLAHESSLFRELLITEREPEAVALIRRNIGETGLTEVVRAREADAREPAVGGPFDYVDLDPYGSPVPYLDSLFGSVGDRTVIAVTATDMMVLAGVVGGACERRYGARPLHGRLAPEGGLRILLAYLARRAREAGRRMVPLLCYVHDHHVRAYLELSPGPEPSADPVEEIHTNDWTGPWLGPRPTYGPLWVGPLFDPRFVDALRPPAVAASGHEVERWIERVREEATVDRPFFYEPNELARRLGLSEPPGVSELIDALRAQGARAARAHPQPSAVRTDAPRALVEEAAREGHGRR